MHYVQEHSWSLLTDTSFKQLWWSTVSSGITRGHLEGLRPNDLQDNLVIQSLQYSRQILRELKCVLFYFYSVLKGRKLVYSLLYFYIAFMCYRQIIGADHLLIRELQWQSSNIQKSRFLSMVNILGFLKRKIDLVVNLTKMTLSVIVSFVIYLWLFPEVSPYLLKKLFL